MIERDALSSFLIQTLAVLCIVFRLTIKVFIISNPRFSFHDKIVQNLLLQLQ